MPNRVFDPLRKCARKTKKSFYTLPAHIFMCILFWYLVPLSIRQIMTTSLAHT